MTLVFKKIFKDVLKVKFWELVKVKLEIEDIQWNLVHWLYITKETANLQMLLETSLE